MVVYKEAHSVSFPSWCMRLLRESFALVVFDILVLQTAYFSLLYYFHSKHATGEIRSHIHAEFQAIDIKTGSLSLGII